MTNNDTNKQATYRTPKRIAIWGAWIIALVGIGWLVSYSLEQYNTENAGEGVFICNEQECFKTVHIHSDIEFDLCDESYVLPRETGPLASVHTHKEKNYLHFHERIDLDPETRDKLPVEHLTAQKVIDVFELNPADYCDSNNVDIYVTVDGERPAEGLQYNWQDGDDIVLVFEEQVE